MESNWCHYCFTYPSSLAHLVAELNTKHHAKAKAAIHVPVRCFYVSSFIQSWLTIANLHTSVTYSFSFHKLSVVSLVALSLLACSITLVNTKLNNSPGS